MLPPLKGVAPSQWVEEWCQAKTLPSIKEQAHGFGNLVERETAGLIPAMIATEAHFNAIGFLIGHNV